MRSSHPRLYFALEVDDDVQPIFESPELIDPGFVTIENQ
jgi:hypothetical protein